MGNSVQCPLPGLLRAPKTAIPKLSELPEWKGIKRIGLDTETYDPDLRKLGCGARRHDSHMVGFSIAIEDGPSFYVPFRHRIGDANVDRKQALRYLADQLSTYTGELVLANASYDLDFIQSETGGTLPLQCSIQDVLLNEAMIYEHHKSYSLDSVAGYYGIEKKDESFLLESALAYGLKRAKDLKGYLHNLPGSHVAEYAERDARLPLEILQKQEKVLQEQGLEETHKLESDLIIPLLECRIRGVKVDQDRLDQIDRWAKKQESIAYDKIHHLTGVRVTSDNIGKIQSTLVPLLEGLGVNLPLTDKGTKSVTADVLKSIDHPVAAQIRRARKMVKLQNTYISGTRRYMTSNGRIHPTLNQLRKDRDSNSGADMDQQGTRTARLSGTHPNIQNQPVRDPEIGYVWRSIYVPDDGGIWACEDFSSQEPRLIVHYAEKSKLPSGIEAAERFRTDPRMDYHSMMASLTGLERSAAKTIFLGLCYGMGEAKLCRSLGLPVVTKMVRGKIREFAGKEGAAILRRFDEKVPFVMQLAAAAQEKARRVGYITALGGRRVRFEKGDKGGYKYTHKALNSLIQPSAATQTKMALLAAHRAGFRIQFQVHDELDLTVYSMKEADQLRDVMIDACKLNVPSVIDVETGPSWGQINDKGCAAVDRFLALQP